MSSRNLIAGLPLATGSALISLAIIAFPEGAFIMEWMGAFLAFYGLSHLIGPRASMTLSGAVLIVGSLGDILLLGGLTPLNWTLANYMVFIHSAAGSLTGHIVLAE
jgi:hypothetical protein